MHFVQILGMFVALATSSSLLQAQVRATPPLLVGQTAILNAPNASLSKEPMAGIKAFFTRVNAAGGVNGRQIELLVADDQYDPEKAAENVKRFVDAGAVALLMPIGTVPSVAAVKAATELKIPLVGPYSGAPGASKSSIPLPDEDQFRGRVRTHRQPPVDPGRHEHRFCLCGQRRREILGRGHAENHRAAWLQDGQKRVDQA
jgi:hypothetical protein